MKALFLGEGPLEGSARYLAAVLAWSKIRFDHRPDLSRIPKAWRKQRYDVVLLSDYRYKAWTPCAREWLTRSVLDGTGLLMIGGWASFTGLVGGYSGSEIEKLLPVRCVPGDDRRNRQALLTGGKGKPVMVCGYHRARPKPGSRTVLEFRDLDFRHGAPILGARHPALVTGRAGKGRTAAFLSDCAPHWAGGLIDWGTRRVQVPVSRKNIVEVGDRYLHFFRHWIRWTAGARGTL